MCCVEPSENVPPFASKTMVIGWRVSETPAFFAVSMMEAASDSSAEAVSCVSASEPALSACVLPSSFAVLSVPTVLTVLTLTFSLSAVPSAAARIGTEPDDRITAPESRAVMAVCFKCFMCIPPACFCGRTISSASGSSGRLT